MTEIELQVDALNAAMLEHGKQVAGLKKNFEKCIVNPAVSLDLRWNLFMRADDRLKNNKPWIVQFPGGVDDLIGYAKLIHIERHEEVTIERIMDSLADHEDEEQELALDMVTFKEYVLSNNIGSYTYDW